MSSTTPLPTPKSEIRYRTLVAGETLFHQDDPTTAIFAVQYGRMRLVRHLADGATVTLYVAHDGDIFSEAALFSPVYHCDAVADIKTEVEIHSKHALSCALESSPQAQQTFMAHLAGQITALRSRLEIRNIRSATERVHQFLQLEVSAGDRTITFTRPLKDIANDIGLTHETFYRMLAKLVASGEIARQGRTITLLGQPGVRNRRP